MIAKGGMISYIICFHNKGPRNKVVDGFFPYGFDLRYGYHCLVILTARKYDNQKEGWINTENEEYRYISISMYQVERWILTILVTLK